MDTVFECDECGRELRYSSEGINRDECGDVSDEEIQRVCEEHADECEGPADVSWRTLAGHYHGGQWSALYAYSSSGTRVDGLTSEVRDAYDLAVANFRSKSTECNWREEEALSDFLAWCESQDDAEDDAQ
jgi:hypothetical protein